MSPNEVPLLVDFSPRLLREEGKDPVAVIDGWRAEGLRACGADAALPLDPGQLVLAIDALGSTRLRLERVDPPPPMRERFSSGECRLGRTWARRFAPVEPHTLAYDATQRALVASLIDDPRWRGLFETGATLPDGLGAGFDERVVEYPWLFSRGVRGRVLDAGSVLNHRHVIERLLRQVEDVTIATLAPEPLAFTSMGVSYLYADLRRLPFRDGWFDQVVCLSTLEHVGMDNASYGAGAPRSDVPADEAARALRELRRVTRPGGRIHLSVPFGRREDHGWFRQFDRADVDLLFDQAGVGSREEAVFLYSSRGWHRVDSTEAIDVNYASTSAIAPDLAVAARAVYCATVTV